MSGGTPVYDFIAYVRTATAVEVEQAEKLLAGIADRCYLASLLYGRDWTWMVGHINRVTLALRERRAELNLPTK